MSTAEFGHVADSTAERLDNRLAVVVAAFCKEYRPELCSSIDALYLGLNLRWGTTARVERDGRRNIDAV